MKKVVVLFLILTLIGTLAFAFTACEDNDEPTIESIKVYVPEGAPALGMAYLMKECPEIDGVKVTYEIVDGASGIKSAVMNGDADVAIMPTNMAATVYNGGVDIRVVGTNSYGLLYMISNQSNVTPESLKGKVVHTIGQGGTPEAVLKKVFAANNIEYVESDVEVEGKVALKFYKEGKEIIQGGIANGSIQYAVLGEPAVSTAIVKNNSYSVAIDLQEAWNAATDSENGYPQTSLVVKASLLDAAESLVVKVAQLTLDGSRALKADAAPYVEFLKEKGVTVPLAGVARANISPAFDAQAKSDIETYLTILLNFEPKLIGGKLPDEKFFYSSAKLK